MAQGKPQPEITVASLRLVVSFADELERCETLDSVFRRAVEFADQHLGLERCSIFTETDGYLHGTYGTNMRREITDEHKQHIFLERPWAERIQTLDETGQPWTLVDEVNYEWDGEQERVVGHSWVALTPIRAAQKRIGVLFNDAAISLKPFDSNRQELVAVFCSLLGSVIERKRIEETLEQERALLRTVLDAVPHFIWVKDLDTRFVLVNTHAQEDRGIDREQLLIGKTDFDVHPLELAQQYYEADQRVIQAGEILRDVEELNVGGDGSLRWFLTTKVPLRDAQGKIIGLVGLARDFSERRAVDDALRESEERYRMVTELISDFAFSVRIQADGTAVSEWITADPFTRLTGYTAVEIPELSQLCHPDDLAALWVGDKAILEGDSISQECRIITKQGETRWLRLRRRPVWDDAERRVVRYFGVAEDITEQRQAAQAQQESERLRLALEKEKELGDLKTRLMLTISHEFRTPLSVAYASTELLERYYTRMSVAQREEHLHRIEAQVHRLTAMLEDISLVIHARFERLALKLEPTSIRKVYETALLQIEDFDDAHERIVLNADDALPDLRLDVRRIQYVLTNLLSNALKYSNQMTPVIVDLRNSNGGIMLKVSDEGVGIPEEAQAHIFEPFFRATNVGSVGGTGLGLSIVKEIVELHHGTIKVHSMVNQGTQITIWLPCE